MINIYIKERALIARIAARVLKTKNVAIVINRTIYLHNTTKENFTNNQTWLLHELKHVQQYRQHGTVSFIIQYLYESAIKGYRNNRFEVQAREAEQDVSLLKIYNVA